MNTWFVCRSAYLAFGFLLLAQSSLLATNLVWVNKDFKNVTGENRDDLEWFINNHVKDAIVNTYTGAPFTGAPKVEELGPAPTTLVTWSGGTVADGETVHVGLLFDKDKLPEAFRFRSSTKWTLGGVAKERVAGSAVFDLFGDPQILLRAPLDPSDPPIDVFDFSYAVVSTPFPLSELTFNNPAIPFIPVPGSHTLFPGDELLVASIDANFGDYVVWQMSVNFSGDPTEDAGHVIMQLQKTPESSTLGLFFVGGLGIALLNRMKQHR